MQILPGALLSPGVKFKLVRATPGGGEGWQFYLLRRSAGSTSGCPRLLPGSRFETPCGSRLDEASCLWFEVWLFFAGLALCSGAPTYANSHLKY